MVNFVHRVFEWSHCQQICINIFQKGNIMIFDSNMVTAISISYLWLILLFFTSIIGHDIMRIRIWLIIIFILILLFVLVHSNWWIAMMLWHLRYNMAVKLYCINCSPRYAVMLFIKKIEWFDQISSTSLIIFV